MAAARTAMRAIRPLVLVPGRHGSAILLVALIGRVLLDVALAILLGEVARRWFLVRRSIRVSGVPGRAARPLVAAVRRRHGRQLLGLGHGLSFLRSGICLSSTPWPRCRFP